MAYYNRNGKILKNKKREMEYLTSGECAAVWHNNEIIFKEYFSDTLIDCRLSPKMFDILKDINNDNFIKLFEIYSDMDLSELIQFKMNVRNFIVDVCIAKYYSDDSVNALYEPIDYILDNFRELDKLFGIFTDNAIIAEDIKRKNVVLSHSGIIIIDPDTFYKTSLPKKDIIIQNKKELLTLFRSICISGIKNIENHDEMQRKVILDLADINVDSKTDITYEISKKLESVKKPIEYLLK